MSLLSGGLPVVHADWWQLSEGLWHALVVDAQRSRSTIPHSAADVDSLISSMRRRLENRMTESQLSQQVVEWAHGSTSSSSSSSSSSNQRSATWCTLHEFRQTLARKNLSEEDISVLLGMYFNELNRHQLRPTSRASHASNRIVVDARRLAVIQDIFLSLDGPGCGLIGLDDICLLAYAEWFALPASEFTSRTSFQLALSAGRILTTLGKDDRSTRQPVSVTMSQVKEVLSQRTIVQMQTTLMNLRRHALFWSCLRDGSSQELRTAPKLSACRNWPLDGSGRRHVQSMDARTSAEVSPRPWALAIDQELSAKLVYAQSNMKDKAALQVEVDRSYLVATYLLCFGPLERCRALVEVADADRNADAQSWANKIADRLKARYKVMVRDSSLLRLFLSYGHLAQAAARVRNTVGYRWTASPAELMQIDMSVQRCKALEEECVHVLASSRGVLGETRGNIGADAGVDVDLFGAREHVAEPVVVVVNHNKGGGGSVHGVGNASICSGTSFSSAGFQRRQAEHPSGLELINSDSNASSDEEDIDEEAEYTHHIDKMEVGPRTSVAPVSHTRRSGRNLPARSSRFSVDSSNASATGSETITTTTRTTTVTKTISATPSVASNPTTSALVGASNALASLAFKQKQARIGRGVVMIENDVLPDSPSSVFSTSSSINTNHTSVSAAAAARLRPDPTSRPIIQIPRKPIPNNKRLAWQACELFRRFNAASILTTEIRKRGDIEVFKTKKSAASLRGHEHTDVVVDWEVFGRSVHQRWQDADWSQKAKFIDMAEYCWVQRALENQEDDVTKSIEIDLNDLINGTRPVSVSGDLVGMSMREKDGMNAKACGGVEMRDIVWESQTLDDVIATVIHTHQSSLDVVNESSYSKRDVGYESTGDMYSYASEYDGGGGDGQIDYSTLRHAGNGVGQRGSKESGTKVTGLDSNRQNSTSARIQAEILACVVPNSSKARKLSCLQNSRWMSKRYSVLFPASLTLVSTLALRQQRADVMPMDLTACALIHECQSSEWMSQGMLFKKKSKFMHTWGSKLCMIGPSSNQIRGIDTTGCYSLYYYKMKNNGRLGSKHEVCLISAAARAIETSPKAKKIDLQSRFVISVSGVKSQQKLPRELIMSGSMHRERNIWINAIQFVASVMGHHGRFGDDARQHRGKSRRRMSASVVASMVPHMSTSPRSNTSASSPSSASSPYSVPSPTNSTHTSHSQFGGVGGEKNGRGRHESGNHGVHAKSPRKKKTIFERGKSSAADWLINSPKSPIRQLSEGTVAAAADAEGRAQPDIYSQSYPQPPTQRSTHPYSTKCPAVHTLRDSSSDMSTTAIATAASAAATTSANTDTWSDSDMEDEKAFQRPTPVPLAACKPSTRSHASRHNDSNEAVRYRQAKREVEEIRARNSRIQKEGVTSAHAPSKPHATDARDAANRHVNEMASSRAMDPGRFSMSPSFSSAAASRGTPVYQAHLGFDDDDVDVEETDDDVDETDDEVDDFESTDHLDASSSMVSDCMRTDNRGNVSLDSMRSSVDSSSEQSGNYLNTNEHGNSLRGAAARSTSNAHTSDNSYNISSRGTHPAPRGEHHSEALRQQQLQREDDTEYPSPLASPIAAAAPATNTSTAAATLDTPYEIHAVQAALARLSAEADRADANNDAGHAPSAPLRTNVPSVQARRNALATAAQAVTAATYATQQRIPSGAAKENVNTNENHYSFIRLAQSTVPGVHAPTPRLAQNQVVDSHIVAGVDDAWLHDPAKLQQRLEELATIAGKLRADAETRHTTNVETNGNAAVYVGADHALRRGRISPASMSSSNGTTPRSCVSGASSNNNFADADPDDSTLDIELNSQPAFHHEAIRNRNQSGLNPKHNPNPNPSPHSNDRSSSAYADVYAGSIGRSDANVSRGNEPGNEQPGVVPLTYDVGGVGTQRNHTDDSGLGRQVSTQGMTEVKSHSVTENERSSAVAEMSAANVEHCTSSRGGRYSDGVARVGRAMDLESKHSSFNSSLSE